MSKKRVMNFNNKPPRNLKNRKITVQQSTASKTFFVKSTTGSRLELTAHAQGLLFSFEPLCAFLTCNQPTEGNLSARANDCGRLKRANVHKQYL